MHPKEILRRLDVQKAAKEAEALMLAVVGDGILSDEYQAFVGDRMSEDESSSLSDWDDVESFAKLRAGQRVAEAVGVIARRLDVVDGRVEIYRAIVVDQGWNIEDRPLGISWCWGKEFVQPYLAVLDKFKHPVEVCITGRVDLNDIDWDMTVGTEAGSYFAHAAEQEIILKAEAMVEVVTLDWRENDFKHDPYFGRENLKFDWQKLNYAFEKLVLQAGETVVPALSMAA